MIRSPLLRCATARDSDKRCCHYNDVDAAAADDDDEDDDEYKELFGFVQLLPRRLAITAAVAAASVSLSSIHIDQRYVVVGYFFHII